MNLGDGRVKMIVQSLGLASILQLRISIPSSLRCRDVRASDVPNLHGSNTDSPPSDVERNSSGLRGCMLDTALLR